MARPKAKTTKTNEATDGKNVVKGKLVPTVYHMVKMENKVLFLLGLSIVDKQTRHEIVSKQCSLTENTFVYSWQN